MPITIQNIIEALEAQLPPHSQEPWDNCGIQVGVSDTPCQGVLLTLDITEEVVAEALNKGCNLIVAHHPLLFKGLKQIGESTYIERCVRMAIQHNLTIYAAHTNADVAPEGLNHLLAESLGLVDISTLEYQNNGIYGLGAIGNLREAQDLGTYLSHLAQHFASEQIRHNATSNKAIQRVALCGGSGAYLWQEAKRQGADIFITGEAKYNDYFDAEGIVLVTVGHYESEYRVTELFERIISAAYPHICHITQTNHNPVKSI